MHWRIATTPDFSAWSHFRSTRYDNFKQNIHVLCEMDRDTMCGDEAIAAHQNRPQVRQPACDGSVGDIHET